MAVMAASKFYTATKYVTQTESGMIISGLWISKPWLNRAAERAARTRHQDRPRSRNMGRPQRKDLRPGRRQALERQRRRGHQAVADADQAELNRRLAPLGDEFLGDDPATKDMYEILKKIMARVSNDAEVVGLDLAGRRNTS